MRYNRTMGFSNLHLHTFFSDGSIGPDELAERIIQQKELNYFAVTDHDTLSGIEPFFRALRRLASGSSMEKRRFIAGIELSLIHRQSGVTVHLLGFFPAIGAENAAEQLRRIDSVLGNFCRYRAEHRALKDVDARIYRAFELNLDGISDRFDAPETVIRIIREAVEGKNRFRFQCAAKQNDVIRHPIPVTYQGIVDHWEILIPSSSREKASLYVLRQDPSRIQRLARIYRSEGMKETAARKLAEKNQGVLLSVRGKPPLAELDVFEGLDLLMKARAVTVLAHPAVDHPRIGYDAFDRRILYPLIESGMDGIEVFYPYDTSFRDEAISRYHSIAREHRLLMSGGTDYHADGRTGLDDVRLSNVEAEKIILHRNAESC
ncbi:MAG: hypothetical protein C4530_09555 [Desulfobacteraceae bacterium]|nr:MAG: hypothetical protein C4530_09555 [Desulfobacteraceae bacterium]